MEPFTYVIVALCIFPIAFHLIMRHVAPEGKLTKEDIGTGALLAAVVAIFWMVVPPMLLVAAGYRKISSKLVDFYNKDR